MGNNLNSISNLDFQSELEKGNNINKRLTQIQKQFGDLGEGFEEFIIYIESLSDFEKEKILSVFDSKDSLEIEEYLMDNPFPTLKSLHIFNDFFGLKTEIGRVLNEEKILVNEKALLNNRAYFDNIYGILKGHNNYSINEFNKIYLGIRKDEIKTLNELYELLSDKNNLREITNKLLSSSGPDSKEYQEFKSLVISINPNLKAEFNRIEAVYKFEKGENSELDKAITASSLYDGGIERAGNFLISGDIKLDMGEVPPTRYLGIKGSEYSLQTELSVGDFSEAVLNYEREMNYIRPDIKRVNGEAEKLTRPRNNIAILDFNSSEGLLKAYSEITSGANMVGKGELSAKIEKLSDKNPVPKEEAEKLKREVIKAYDDALKLVNKEKEGLEGKVQVIKEVYIAELALMKSEYTAKLKQKDEKVKETLKFLKATGFDQIPQKYTNLLISDIKGLVYSVEGLSLNPETIDLESGTFGETTTEEGTTMWKENLVKFMNKLIYGEVNPESSILNVETLVSSMGATVDPADIKTLLQEKGITSAGTGFNISIMRENLKRKEE